MAKSKETYEKVAATYKKMADKDWAAAKNNPGEEYKYASARKKYNIAKSAAEAAKKAK